MRAVTHAVFAVAALTCSSACGLADAFTDYTSPLAEFLNTMDVEFRVTVGGQPACGEERVSSVTVSFDGEEQTLQCANADQGQVSVYYTWDYLPTTVRVELVGSSGSAIRRAAFVINEAEVGDSDFDIQPTGNPADRIDPLPFEGPEGVLNIDFPTLGGVGGGGDCTDAAAGDVFCSCTGTDCECSPVLDGVATCECLGPDCDCLGSPGACICSGGFGSCSENPGA